jgi:hypothetical protein
MVQEVRQTRFGRVHVPEPDRSLELLHRRVEGEKLVEVDHEPKVAVLDQEDLDTQGIDVSTFIPKAPKGVTALGSCTANTAIEALSNLLSLEQFVALLNQLGDQDASGTATDVYANTVACERAAIGFYHGCTDQTKEQSQEWPPTDCGSSGLYVVEYMKKLKLVTTEKVATGSGDSIASLMQDDGCMWGTPFLNAWMDPTGPSYFIDGDGKVSTLQKQIGSGVAGGHEIYLSAIERLAMLETGGVDSAKTILRFRNHWDPSWADHGSARVHLSTLVALARYADVRRAVVSS